MTTSHLAMLMECRRVLPVWLVLMSGHTAPSLVAPNQMEGISGQFPIMTATVSPRLTPLPFNTAETLKLYSSTWNMGEIDIRILYKCCGLGCYCCHNLTWCEPKGCVCSGKLLIVVSTVTWAIVASNILIIFSLHCLN